MKTANVYARKLGVGVTLVFLGCSSPLEVIDVTQADFAGTVESVRTSPQGTDVLLTEITPPPEPAREDEDPRAAELHLKKGVWIVARSRVVVRQADGTHRSGTASDVMPGVRLRVKTTDVEWRSLPPQYEAVWVEISPIDAQ